MPDQIAQLERRCRELEQSNQELSQANEQLIQFVNILANDLRSPLRHVMGFCSIVKHDSGDKLGPRGTAFLDNAILGAKRIRELVDDLVTITQVRQQGFQHQPVNLATIVDEVMTSLAAPIRESRARITRDRLPTVVGSPMLLRVLLQNLIDNAIKYRGDERPEISITERRVPEGWEFAIADNGIGIAQERHEGLFDAFQRTGAHAAYSTSGLGLFVCKEIVERHRGRIWVESTPGKGTVFHFTIAAPPANDSA